MATFDWKTFLKRWSEAILDTGAYNHFLTPDAHVERWLGETGATEAQIAAAESRLNVKFPPSYRSFLFVTNGWALTTPAIGEIWSADQLKRFAELYPKFTRELRDSRRIADAARFADELGNTVGISDAGESGLYLLNPAVVDTVTSEWEAWHFTPEDVEAVVYPSFQALMEAEYQEFASRFLQHPKRSRHEPRLEALDWQSFLSRFSEEMLAGDPFAKSFGDLVTAEQRESKWLGFAPATDEQIAAAEARLGIKLPPSYRAFLKTSNGWSVIEPFIYRIYPVEEIGFLRDRVEGADIIEAYTEANMNFGSPTPDDVAFAYALHNSIALSEYGDAILLLNPTDVDEVGEMEAWFFANWVPGEERFDSFEGMLEEQYRSFLRMRQYRT